MRALVAAVLSVCAIAAITMHELAPEVLSGMRAKVEGPVVEPAGPSDLEPPVDLADAEPIGPATLRPDQVETTVRPVEVETTVRLVQVETRKEHRAISRPKRRRRLADR